MFDDAEMDKIHNMVVYIAGAGGLGTHQALELQRIGVKKIYLVDSDRVEISNLNRQILYGRKDLGEYKAKRSKEVLDDFELGTEIVAYTQRITAKTVIPPDVQVIFDAFDSFESRLALEDLAQKYNLPLIHGGVQSCYGQVTTIIPGKTRRLREIVGELSVEELAKPTYSPVVSLIASLQVIEGVKVLLDRSDTLVNRLLILELRDYSMEIMEL